MKEIRKIKINGEWKYFGDDIMIDEKLFWFLPFKVKRKYKIGYIDIDASAMIFRTDNKGDDFSSKKYIGEVNISYSK